MFLKLMFKLPFIKERHFKKTLLIMKFTAILLFAACMQVSATGYSQKITLSQNNVSLKKVFKEIENQSGYHFFYKDKLLRQAENVSIHVRDASLEEALDQCFKDQPLSFTILDKIIVVKARPPLPVAIQALSVLPALPVNIITGTVKDEKGNPLAGVSIIIKGTNKGTSSKTDGTFTIDANVGEVLVLTMVGYQKRSVTVGRSSNINVVMEIEVMVGNEVVVVGYGSQKKSDLTGSISSIKGKDMALLPTGRADQALQGRAAGVMVLNSDGAPGGNTTIRIRGINSINGGNNALIVIDGLQGGDLNSLNPNDIASVEILKDASATAIYGSQGANGVILVTTKTGKLGKPVINYDYENSIAKIAKKIPLLNAAEYAKNINAVRLSQNGNGVNPRPIFSDAQINAFEKNGGTDWQDVIYRTGITQNHQLSISGATEKTSYLASAGYLDQDGIMLNSGYKRFSLRAVLRTDITKWLNFNVNWAGTMERTNSVQFGSATDWPANPVGSALRFSPTIPVFDSTGNYSKAALNYGEPALWNPLASLVEPLIKNTIIKNNINAYLEFKLIEGLTLRITGGAILANSRDINFFNTKTFIGLPANGSGEIFTDLSEYYQNSNILTYDKTFNKKHHLTFTAVAEQKYSIDNSSATDGGNFLNQQTGIYDMAGASLITSSSSQTKRVINSYLGRANYIFAGKYLLTASYRADGSSVFGKNNKWGYFPSAALAWRASEENFIKDLNFFSDLKLRASWGITGNQAIQPYQTLSRISSGSNYPYNGTDATDLGLYVSSSANPNLKWESTTQTNFGIDMGFLEGRLMITADYYDKTTKNLLMPRELPAYSGFTSVIDNVGSMGNKGIEFSVSGEPISQRDFRWHSSFNISANRTTVLDLGGSPTKTKMIGYKSGGSGQGTNRAFMYLVRGKTFGQMIGYGYEGVWKESQATEAAVYGQLPGDPHYTDKNNDGKINSLDTMVIGHSLPKFVFGWNNQITFKNFDLSFLIQGQQGNDIFNVARIKLDQTDGTSTRLLNRWTPQNQNSDIPGIIDARTREEAGLVSKVSFPSSAGNTLSRYVEDGSYIRLKNVTLNYNFPSSFTDRLKLNNLKVFVGVTNLITLTKYTGFDPEVSSFTGNDAQLGSDYNNYPSSRTFSLGLNVSF
ncbi:MAG: TonB-dependent receptor [Ginsengibacter sp.]